MRKQDRQEIESQFDVVKEWRYTETLELVDIVRLIKPYYKGKLTQTQQKLIVEKYFDLLYPLVATKVYKNLPLNFIKLYGKENKLDKIFVEKIVKRSDRNTVGKYLVRDRNTEWENEIKNDGKFWTMEASVVDTFDFYNIKLSEEANDLINQSVVENKRKFTSEPLLF